MLSLALGGHNWQNGQLAFSAETPLPTTGTLFPRKQQPPQGEQEGREYACLPDRKDFLVTFRKRCFYAPRER